MKRIIVAVALTFFLSSIAYALPAPKASKLQWDDYTDPDATGFHLYWVREKPEPRVYTDAQKVNLGLDVDETITIIDFLSSAQGRLCFRLTAYDAAGNESDFSNEACGFFGVGVPGNLRVVP
jgi:hypothetical protein